MIRPFFLEGSTGSSGLTAVHSAAYGWMESSTVPESTATQTGRCPRASGRKGLQLKDHPNSVLSFNHGPSLTSYRESHDIGSAWRTLTGSISFHHRISNFVLAVRISKTFAVFLLFLFSVSL